MIMYLNKRIIFGWLLLGGLFAGACGEDEPAPAAEPLDLSIRAGAGVDGRRHRFR